MVSWYAKKYHKPFDHINILVLCSQKNYKAHTVAYCRKTFVIIDPILRLITIYFYFNNPHSIACYAK